MAAANYNNLAERLFILHTRSEGLLIRLYNAKKNCHTAKARPKVLNDKNLEPLINQIIKKFPVVDVKKNANALTDAAKDICSSLYSYYYTLIYLLEFKEQFMSLVTEMNTRQLCFDISVNYDITKAYLSLISNYVAVMILLSQIEDRKVIVMLYHLASEMRFHRQDPHHARLVQMIVDHEHPMRKVSEDLAPIHNSIGTALTSLGELYRRRNVSAEEQRNSGMLSLTSNPQQLVFAAQTDTCACEYMSLDLMDRCIIFCMTACHQTLFQNDVLVDLYYRALRNGISVKIVRDENVMVYTLVLNFFESIKGYGKRVQEIKELYNLTLHTCASFHAHRRQFLRSVLRDLCFLTKDQPGLLGPKILLVWIGLSCARDEVLWLLRHFQAWPTILSSKKGKDVTDVGINDKSLPELLFYMMDLKQLVEKHSKSISNYHQKYIEGYDSVVLKEMFSELDAVSDREVLLFSGIYDELENISRDDRTHDLTGARMDWCRLQTSLTLSAGSKRFEIRRQFMHMMNTTIFHSRMVDDLESMLAETCDLTTYCFYHHQFDSQLMQSLNLPMQSRYSIAYALMTTGFIKAVHPFCPEEYDDVIERCLSHCNAVLDRLANRISGVINRITSSEMVLMNKLSPLGCAECISNAYSTGVPHEMMPGTESYRKDRLEITEADKNCSYLTDLCHAMGYVREVKVVDHVFTPKEYLYQHLENDFVTTMMAYFRSTQNEHPRRPSEMLTFLEAKLLTIQRLETCLRIDTHKFVNRIMSQQSQLQDVNFKDTLTTYYTKWYLEVLLRQASFGRILFSDHLRIFIGAAETPPAAFEPEQYTDARELRALVQVIGPYGTKLLAERLVWHVASQIAELFKLVREHCVVLKKARVTYDKPEQMRELVAALSVPDNPKDKRKDHQPQGSPIESVLQRVTIIGEIMAFRSALYDALQDVIKTRMPFLMRSLSGLVQSADRDGHLDLSEMSLAAGIQTDIDLALINSIQAHTKNFEDVYGASCLLLVFIAIALPKLATNRQSLFKASNSTAANNCHVIPYAVNAIAGALFYKDQSDIQARMQEFLALASSSLLQIIGTPEANEMEMYQSVFTLLETLIKDSPYLSFGLLESCFPFTMVRSAFSKCFDHN